MSMITLGELARRIDAELSGDASLEITGLATLESARHGQVSFLSNEKYRKQVSSSNASAIILHPALKPDEPGNYLLSDNPYLAFARATHVFADKGASQTGIHPSAIIPDSCVVADSAMIGPGVTMGENTRIEGNVRISANCHIGKNCSIGAGSTLNPNITLYPDVVIGERCIIHSGVVIGADGFGFAPDGENWHKIEQLGGVRIGNDVEIGANSCIDRGALENTCIGNGVKIDNLVQIAHNVIVGDNTVMAGCSAIAGSAVIGKNCRIGGGAGIVGHIHVTDNVTIMATSLVTHDIREAGEYTSVMPLQNHRAWRKNAARLRKLDEMALTLKHLKDTKDK